jgi:hypothetical protein
MRGGSGAGGANADASMALLGAEVTSASAQVFPSKPRVFCVSDSCWAAGNRELNNVENLNLPSCNYLHGGEDKFWIV